MLVVKLVQLLQSLPSSLSWTIRLGDGTEESAARMANAVADLAPYIDEMFLANAETDALPDPSILRTSVSTA